MALGERIEKCLKFGIEEKACFRSSLFFATNSNRMILKCQLKKSATSVLIKAMRAVLSDILVDFSKEYRTECNSSRLGLNVIELPNYYKHGNKSSIFLKRTDKKKIYNWEEETRKVKVENNFKTQLQGTI